MIHYCFKGGMFTKECIQFGLQIFDGHFISDEGIADALRGDVVLMHYRRCIAHLHFRWQDSFICIAHQLFGCQDALICINHHLDGKAFGFCWWSQQTNSRMAIGLHLDDLAENFLDNLKSELMFHVFFSFAKFKYRNPYFIYYSFLSGAMVLEKGWVDEVDHNKHTKHIVWYKYMTKSYVKLYDCHIVSWC